MENSFLIFQIKNLHSTSKTPQYPLIRYLPAHIQNIYLPIVQAPHLPPPSQFQNLTS